MGLQGIWGDEWGLVLQALLAENERLKAGRQPLIWGEEGVLLFRAC